MPPTDLAVSADDALLRILDRSRQLGFLGPGDPMFHVEHSDGFSELVGTAARVLDLGSGGGVPGLVLALRQPSSRVVLLDAMQKRCVFLEAAVGELRLSERVTIVCGRAEVVGRDLDHRGAYDAVTSRSFGPPAATAECAAPFLAVGGVLVVSEPPEVSASDERWDASGLGGLGMSDQGHQERSGFSFRVVRQESPCPERFPRRDGIPAKRPLF